MYTEVTLYINDIKIPIAPVDFEYGVSSSEMSQIATISPPTSVTGSKRGATYVYRDLGEKYIDLTFNIRMDEKSWRHSYGSTMKTDTDSTDEIKPKYDWEISNPQEFINWMIYAHGSGEPLKITIEKYTKNANNNYYTHMLTGTYKVSHTSISSSASRLYHYATFSLGLVRYMPPVMEKVKLVRLGDDTADVDVYSTAVESYEPVQTAGPFRTRYSNDVYSSSPDHSSVQISPLTHATGLLPPRNTSDPLEIIRRLRELHKQMGLPDVHGLVRPHIELIPVSNDVSDDENTTEGYLKILARDTIAQALTTISKNSASLLREVFIENPMGLYNREDPLTPLKVLGTGFWRVFKRGAYQTWNHTRMGLITAAGMVNPVLKLGVEATLNLASGLVSKIPFPSLFSEGVDASTALDASAETPLLGDGGIVISSDTDLGFDPKLHATGFDSETISPVYRILEPGIYKKE